MPKRKKQTAKSKKTRKQKPQGELRDEDLDGVAGGLTALSGQTVTKQPLQPTSALDLFDDSSAVFTGDGSVTPKDMMLRLSESEGEAEPADE